MHNNIRLEVIKFKKKIISLSLVGLSIMGGNAFAASSVSNYCSLKGYYTDGSNFYAQSTTTSPSQGLKKILTNVSSNAGHYKEKVSYNPYSGNTVSVSLTGSNASRIYSDHIWTYPTESEEISKSLYLD